MVSELKRNAVKKDNGEIDNKDHGNIETQAKKKDPHHLAKPEVGEIIQIEEIEKYPGKKKEEQHNQQPEKGDQ